MQQVVKQNIQDNKVSRLDWVDIQFQCEWLQQRMRKSWSNLYGRADTASTFEEFLDSLDEAEGCIHKRIELLKEIHLARIVHIRAAEPMLVEYSSFYFICCDRFT
jgi:hypothetical protein